MTKTIIGKITAIACSLALTVTSLTGCGLTGTSGSGAGGMKFLFVCNDVEGDDFLTLLSNATVAAGSENGVTVDTAYSNNSVEEQMQQIADAKSGGYSAIICRLTDVSTALQAEVAADGLPIIFVNSSPDDDRLEASKYVYVGSPEDTAGQLQAEAVWNALGKPSSVKAVMMMGESIHPAAIARTQGVADYFEDNGVKVEYVFKDYADWSDTKAHDYFQTFLGTKKEYDCVFCNNDSMAVGVISCMEENKIDPSTIPVAGSDGTAAGCQLIADGKMLYSGFQSAEGQGTKAIESAIAIVRSGSIKKVEGAADDHKYVWVPYEAITKDNVSKYQ